MKTAVKVALYNVLICTAVACLGVVIGMIWGPAAMLPFLGVVACAVPLGRVVWP